MISAVSSIFLLIISTLCSNAAIGLFPTILSQPEGAEKSNAAGLSTKQQLLSEELKHTSRIARLIIIKQLAIEDDYSEIIQAAQTLIEKEYERHNETIAAWIESKNQNDSNSIWWRDVGKNSPDSNSSSLLIKKN